MSASKPDYGIDAPGVIRNLLLVAFALLVIGHYIPRLTIGAITFGLRAIAPWMALICVLEAVAMILYSKFGKFYYRDRMLSSLQWSGHETVLDVGTGRGLLMIGAAKKLTTGKAIGIDIWSQTDLSGNSSEKTRHNIEFEGVSDRAEVKDQNATQIQFPDGSFDVVLSNLCLHNIPTRQARDQACREIVRVLKPGGKALVSDFKHTRDYVIAFRSAGATAVRSGFDWLHTFPPLRMIKVTKSIGA
jgi:SAM-dependent methyltransferase